MDSRSIGSSTSARRCVGRAAQIGRGGGVEVISRCSKHSGIDMTCAASDNVAVGSGSSGRTVGEWW